MRRPLIGLVACGIAGILVGLTAGASAQGPSKRALMGAVKPIGPYTPGVLVGNVLYLSGQIGLSPTTGALVDGGVRAEARQALDNLGAVLKEAGLGFEHVVKTTIYVADINDFATVNEVYAGYFTTGSITPARSTVGVAALPRGARVEIEFTAVR